MRRTATALAGTVILAGGAGVVPATPARAAEPDITGTYSFEAEDGENATWVLSPCAGDADMCMRVSETGNAERAPWSGDAHYSVGAWILFVQQPDAILCADGSAVPGMNTYSWDAVALTGSASIITRGACGAKSGSLSIPFKLTRIGLPPAAPVDAPAPPPDPSPATPAPSDVPPAPQPNTEPPASEGPLSAESPVEPPAPQPQAPAN